MRNKLNKVIQVVSVVEIFIGSLFLVYSTYLLFDIYLFSGPDRHGYALLGSIYFAGLGGLFGFAGMVLNLQKWYSVLLQLILLVQSCLFGLQFFDLL